jgi:ferrous iron transport protein A
LRPHWNFNVRGVPFPALRTSLNHSGEPSAPRRRTLADVAVGDRATVVGIDAPPDVRRRLLELGVLPGCRLSVVRRAPLGCPLEFDLRGARYAVRRETAAAIVVEEEAA